jgi:hypothetical protein
MALVWAVGFAFAAALILHPHLGGTIRVQSGDTPTDFLSALFAGGTSLALTGSSEFLPKSDAMRLFYLFTSIVGTSMVTLAVTYIVQVYTGLQLRNSYALELELYTEDEADAAQLIVALAPGGDFAMGASTLAQIGQGMTRLKEAYHFHPVIFYFRSATVRFSPARLLLVAFDAVTLMRTALEEGLAARLASFAPVTQLRQAAMLLADTLEGTFLARPDPPDYRADDGMRERWRQRFVAARAKLADAGLAVCADADEGAGRYIALREKWQRHVEDLGDYMAFRREEVDPVLLSSPRPSPKGKGDLRR